MKTLRVPLLFAFRYLLSKKSVNAINIISLISIIGVFVSTAALVIVLSFYNGMEKFILSMYSNFTPDLRIEPTEGKSFDPKNNIFLNLAKDNHIKSYSEVLEDKLLIQYDSQQYIAKIKGIDPKTLAQHNQYDMLQSGDFSIQDDSSNYAALIGAQIQANLRIPITQGFNSVIDLYFPRKDISLNNINPLEDFNIRSISVNGILTYEPEFDNLLLVPIDFTRDILGETKNISAIELYIKDSGETNKIQKELKGKLGESFKIKNREQQNPTLYKTIKSEKWIVFFILTFIGIIAIFNIIGSLTMLVIDKKDDMNVLQHLGGNKNTIENIFFIEGLLISLIGSVIGIIIGYIFCVLQDTYGFIKTGNIEGSLMDVYPIDIRWQDFALVFLTVFLLSAAVSYLASKLSVKEIGKNNTVI